MRHTGSLPRCMALGLLVLLGIGMAEQGGKYLVIAADNYVNIVKPLADWRTKKGLLAKVVPVSQIGANPSAIQTYIRTAWADWVVKPEFVLLAGDVSQVPPYNSSTDCQYGDVTGDWHMDISVGRFFATTARECSTMVNRALAYERPVWSGDTLWMRKGSTCVREDNAPDDTIYWGDARLAHGYWMDRTYVEIDSFSTNRGNGSGDVNAAAAEGRNFITYRGQGVSSWWGYQSITPSSWNNGQRTPIVVAGTCATMSLQTGESMYGDQFVRAGSPSGLGGAQAYFGTTGVISHGAYFRSAVFQGFFMALFAEKNPWLGPATVRGRWRVDSLYANQARYQEWVLFGDPALLVWVSAPRHGVAAFDTVIPMAAQNFDVTVTADGSPVPGALVCVMMDSAVYATGNTNTSGQVSLAIDPTHVGTMSVTVTGASLLPIEGTSRVMVSNEPYLVVNGTGIDDYQGNHDQVPNPGEQLRLSVGLHNMGGIAANGVNAVLRLSTAGVRLIDSTSSYGTIAPESTVTGDPFELALDTTLIEGLVVNATLYATDAGAHAWSCPVTLTVRAGDLQFVSATLLDDAPGGNGNGRLGAGESGRLEVSIRNAGGGTLSYVSGVLETDDTCVVITDDQSFYGTVHEGQTVTGAGDRYALAASLALPRNLPVSFRVRIIGNGGTYHYADTFSFTVQAEQGGTGDPTGPDPYGYWCYDNTDVSSGRAPTYDWVDISGVGTVIPAVSDSDAATRQLTMPFTFKMYGATNNILSACSNGFLALGVTTYSRGTNRAIPDTIGPPLMISPFWDDLNPNEAANGYGTAYQYFDTANHRFIVEYQDFAHYNQPTIREGFEVILYDPAYYPTPTTDGDIVFQYNRVSLNSGCTVGIENQTETFGIQYLYNNTYATGAAYLQTGRALRFTTWPPTSSSQPWLYLVSERVSDSLYGNNNGIADPGELLTVQVTVSNGGSVDATNVAARLRALDGDGTVQDSAASLGNIGVGGQANNAGQLFTYRVAGTPSDSIAELAVALNADGYATIGYFSFGLGIFSGIETRHERLGLVTGLARVWPNPATGFAHLGFSLARAGTVDLGLFDATGRRLGTIASGTMAAGRYSAGVNLDGLAQGVYFCRMTVQDAGRTERFMRKLQVVR